MKSLRSRIFLFSVVLIMLVLGVILGTIYISVQDQERKQIAEQLETAEKVFDNQHSTSNEHLAAYAETVAKDYGLLSVFNDDPRSLLIALNNHRKRIDAEFAIAINNDNQVIGELIKKEEEGKTRIIRGEEIGKPFLFSSWLENIDKDYFYYLSGQVYQIRLERITTGSKLLGYVGFGFVIDDAVANIYSSLTGLNTAFGLHRPDGWKLVGAHTAEYIDEEQDHSTFLNILDNDGVERQILIVRPLGSVAAKLDGKELMDLPLSLVMYSSKTNITESLENSWSQLVALAFAILIVSSLGAFVISGDITKPLKQLVERARHIARGNYGEKVHINDQSEMAQLAEEFNTMQDAVLTREQQITHSLYHEALTDLPNRKRAVEILNGWIANNKSSFAIFLLNVRGVSEINDTLGYEVGNEVICEVAKRLNTLRFNPLLHHLGADEFLLLVDPALIDDEGFCSVTISDDVCTKLLQNIEEAFNHSFYCRNMNLHLRTSMGITTFPVHGDNSATLIQKAYTAMRQARKNNVWAQIYDASQDFNTVERLRLINDLKEAIDSDQLVLFYQPKMSLATRKIHHVEALVRWIHPQNGMVRPDEFISLAEQTGQINALTEWVLNEAARQHKAWLDIGLTQHIAVNISAENLKIPNFPQLVTDILARHSIPHSAISLEVTESAVVDDPKFAINVLNEFKRLGFKLSIDDYGTGYSSLAQLKQLPVHELKIDKSFVQHLMESKDDQVIVHSTIDLSHNMGLSVVAEGIEDEPTLELLAAAECELAQGYFISRPVPADDYVTWLKASDFCPQISELQVRH